MLMTHLSSSLNGIREQEDPGHLALAQRHLEGLPAHRV